jgi:ABC-2 type transport system permease protein
LAGLDASSTGVSVPAQFRAVTQMRWRMFLNSLRTRRGSFELGARVMMQSFFSMIGLAIGSGLGFAAWQIASHDSLRVLAALLWPVFVFWQLIPISVASFQENADLSFFLRFPVNFGSYALFYVLFGLFDVGTLVGGIGLFGIWVGASLAQPGLIALITLALALFAAFNILLTRMIFAWIERWLAQRKTREVLGVVFLLLLLCAQLMNPVLHQQNRHRRRVTQSQMLQDLRTVERVQNVLPPGLTANAISNAHRARPFAAATDLFLVALFAAAAGAILGIRLHAEYRGESLGEAPPQMTATARTRNQRTRLEGSGPIAAVIEKEIRYIMRSGIMLYGFLAPLVIVFIFGGGGRGHGLGLSFGGQYLLPVGIAYGFLGLTRFIYNNLGGEGAGIQLYFLSPTPFRKVMLAKNIVHTSIFVVELALVFLIVELRSGMPDAQILVCTFCWLLFAIPAQLAIGNILSITMPYRMSMTRMSREQGAAGNGLLSILVEVLVFAVGAAVYLPLATFGHAGWAALILLVLAAGSILFWLRVLSNSAAMAHARQEILIANLYRAA